MASALRANSIATQCLTCYLLIPQGLKPGFPSEINGSEATRLFRISTRQKANLVLLAPSVERRMAFEVST
jgi:hypothetical protein